ncbi:MAG TPA: antibiotic biosynthesis monooxygenase [Gammaproteobacteria bacterium]|nr:antibiotic biosynthesis monooxygenase [Gammaproteobacteria bacterium]
MFVVVYRWRVRADKEQQFQQAWELLTRELLTAGSLGSRLHRSSDRVWVAYAQWPSRATWERVEISSKVGQAALDSLQSTVDERFEPLLLDPVADYLVTGVSS